MKTCNCNRERWHVLARFLNGAFALMRCPGCFRREWWKVRT